MLTSTSARPNPLRAGVSLYLQRGLALATVAATLTATIGTAHAWGAKGHEIVGGIAAQRLTSANAKAEVERILAGQTMAQASTWADLVKKLQPGFVPTKDHGELAKDVDTLAFVQQFSPLKPTPPGHVIGGSGPWHYVDLPLQSAGYDAPGMTPDFVGKPLQEDVVMRIQDCIAVLRDKDAKVEGAWGKHNALRMLIHLVGDIHQPLHVTSGFLDPEQTDLSKFIVWDPEVIKARHLKDDMGGNALLFPDGNLNESLHGHWDETLVDDAVAAAVKSERIATTGKRGLTKKYTTLLATQAAPDTWKNTGDPATWPVQWTAEALQQSRVAYSAFKVVSGKKELLPTVYSRTNEGYLIKLDDDYDARMTPVAETQLAKGGYHLAQLLDAIWP